MAEALRAEKMCKSFGDLQVLKDVDLKIEKGETVVLIGASGSGKSTLLRCLNFMEIPTSGRLILSGKPVGEDAKGQVRYRERDLAPIRARVGMVFQHFNLFPHMTAAENVMEGPRTVLGLDKSTRPQRAKKYLEKVGMAEKADAYPAHLSGGQQQRVAIARALAMEPEIMLFDEATSALDPELVGEVLDTMKELADEGITMVVVTHELGFAYSVADRVLFLHGGGVLEEGSPSDVLTRPRMPATQRFLRGHGRFSMPEVQFDNDVEAEDRVAQ